MTKIILGNNLSDHQIEAGADCWRPLLSRCWSLQSGKCERILRGHADTVTCMKLFEDHLVSGARDHMCKGRTEDHLVSGA